MFSPIRRQISFLRYLPIAIKPIYITRVVAMADEIDGRTGDANY